MKVVSLAGAHDQRPGRALHEGQMESPVPPLEPAFSASIGLIAVIVSIAFPAEYESSLYRQQDCFRSPLPGRGSCQPNGLPPDLMPPWGQRTGCALEPVAPSAGALASVPVLAAGWRARESE